MVIKRTITIKEKHKFAASHSFAYFFAFTIPVLLLLLIFYRNQFYPFGDHTVMTRELFDRFVPFFSEFRRKIVQSESIFYTWNIAGGMNFFAVIGHYLSSPFNLLLLPFSAAQLPLGLSMLVFVRTGLSGLFMAVFIRKKEPEIHTFLLIFFASAYSLCGYAIAYFWAFMWLDAFVFLPLVVLGAYLVCKGKRPLLYTIFLFLVFLSQYSMGFYVLFFSLLMAGVFWIENKTEKGGIKALVKAELRLIFSGVISLGMASFMFLPAVRALSQSRVSDPIDYIQSFYTELTLFDVGTRLFYGAFPAVDYKTPNIYIPMAALFLVPLYGLCVKLKLSERLATIAIAILIYVLMTSRVLNYWLNGFRFVQDNHYKYAFLLSFLLLYMGIRAVLHLRSVSKKQIVGVLFAFLIYIVLYNQIGEVRPDTKTIYTLLLLLLTSVVLWWLFCTYEKKHQIINAFLLLFICVELFFSGTQGYVFLQNAYGFESHEAYSLYLEGFDRARTPETTSSSDRNIFINPLTENDGALLGVADIGGAYEYQNRGFAQFMDFLGMMNSSREFDAHRLSIFAAQLMSVRNIYQRKLADMSDRYQGSAGPVNIIAVIDTGEKKEEITELYRLSVSAFTGAPGIVVEQNVYVLPPGSSSVVEAWNIWLEHIGFKSFYVPGNLNYLWGHNTEYKEEEGLVISRFPGEADTFFDFGDVQNTSLLIIHSDHTAVTRIRIKTPGRQADLLREWVLVGPAVVDSLAFFEDAEYETTCRFSFRQIDSEGVIITALGIDIEMFENYLDEYQDRSFIPEVWVSGYIEGHIRTDQKGTLVLMMPYDEGWTATINEKEVTANNSFGGLLGFPIDSGESLITLQYTPPGLRTGVLLSIQSLMILLLLSWFNPFGVYYDSKKNMTKRQSEDEKRIKRMLLQVKDRNTEESWTTDE